MKPIVSTFLVSFLLTLGLTGCQDYGEETAGVGEEEGIYEEETQVGEEEGLYQEEQEVEVVEQPGIGAEQEEAIGAEQEQGFGEQEGIAEDEQNADVEIVEEGEELDLPEESPAAGEEQQPIQ